MDRRKPDLTISGFALSLLILLGAFTFVSLGEEITQDNFDVFLRYYLDSLEASLRDLQNLNISEHRIVTEKDLEPPCQIETYGDAWEGYLAYGLWHFNKVSSLDIDYSYLVIMGTNGELMYLRDFSYWSYWDVEFIPPNLVMYQGELWHDTHFLDLESNEITELPNEVQGHHDIEYNPETNTFLTLNKDVRDINGTKVQFDSIVEFNEEGDIFWQWYVADYFDVSQRCPHCGYFSNGALDFSHCNTVAWNQEEDIVYLNVRNLNTFCKINKTSGELIWSCGEYGDFTLLDADGNEESSLWYHSHSVKEVEPNVFLMFDNDFHNKTYYWNERSRMIEVTVDEDNMTAWISWKWTAPEEYWSHLWGDADRLPNGNRIGTFGTPGHDVYENIGALLIEVNNDGEVVRKYTFPYGWGIYRIEQIEETEMPPEPTISNFEKYFANNNVRMIYPSDSPYKPLNCSPAMLSDWLASAFVYSRLGTVAEGLDTNPGFVDQATGKAVGDSGDGIISFGGQFVNPVVKYAEGDDPVKKDKAPVKFHLEGDVFRFQYKNGTNIPGAWLPQSVINEDEDMFVIEVYEDVRGRFNMLCYGFGWKGTLAAGKYFDTTICDDFGSYPYSWMIVRWEDSNMNGFVNTETDGDTYTTIATGS